MTGAVPVDSSDAPGAPNAARGGGPWPSDESSGTWLQDESREPWAHDESRGAWLQDEWREPLSDHIVITGGAGFVGTNLAHRLMTQGETVLVVDNLARQGSLDNLRWLGSTHGAALRHRIADVRDALAMEECIRGAKAVFHLAAQVAVTTSLADPLGDFATNAQGTLHVLEAVRRHAPQAFVLYASTNKVYGELEGVDLVERPTRWEPRDGKVPARSLRFATPYGCSKGAADQYVLDYARTFDLQATVFRMSCIYGPHQNGTADQGWVAHFVRCAVTGRQVTVCGDGKQVRDVLHVDDLVDAYLAAMQRPGAVRGRAWDVGGGTDHTMSLIELMDLLEHAGAPLQDIAWDVARPSDQRYYVSDIRPLTQAIGWRPRIAVQQGIRQMIPQVEVAH